MAGIHASAFMNANRDTKVQKDPFELPMPWPEESSSDEVTADERAQLRATLLRRSAFAN
jgi:hypothetical protein